MAKSKRGRRNDSKEMVKTESDRRALADGCTFSAEHADRVCKFFSQFLRLSKGQWAGDPFQLQPWQRDNLLRPLFGWLNPDGTRRHRLAYVEIAKKNGKSALASGIALYLAVADNEPGAEVYCAAADRQQASIVFGEARSMVRKSKALEKYCKVTDSKKRIDFTPNGSYIRVISSEAYTAEGLNIHGLIFDELHAQKTRELWDALRYGGAARRQPLLMSITTAGWDTTTICYEQHEYARKVLSGEIVDPSFFPLIYAADSDDDPCKKSTWKRANPSLGVTINERDFVEAAREAVASPVKLNSFKRYRLNIWTEQADRWLDIEKWKACGSDQDPVEWRKEKLESLKGNPCYAGLDLGSVSDLTALVLHFDDDTIMPFFWVPRSALEDRAHANRDLYRTWESQGFLIVTEGNVTDYDSVRVDLNVIARDYHIREIAVDRLFQGAQLCTQLMEDGFDVIAFGQGFASMAAPCKEFENRVLSGRLSHGNNPILNWMAGNVTVATDPAGNMKPMKPKRGAPYKIDGIVAEIMALARVSAAQDVRSVYESGGIKIL